MKKALQIKITYFCRESEGERKEEKSGRVISEWFMMEVKKRLRRSKETEKYMLK